MGQRGYRSGENHLHVSCEDLAGQLAAEDLDFGTSMQWWFKTRYQPPPGKGFVRNLEFAGQKTPTSVYDYEIENSWGAAYVLGQPEALNIKNDGAKANLPIIKKSHQAGALVCYQGGWSREVLFDTLLGFVDVVNVCNNNFHRHIFQPRSRYSNLLNVEGFPVYPDTAQGMMKMNTDTYYRMLNCGLKLAAGAGSATGAKPNPIGYNRAYVRTPENATLIEFLQAWRQGKNFVTCGPMIFLTVNDKSKPGDTINIGPQGGKVSVKTQAVSDQPLTSLEIIVNGKVVAKNQSFNATFAKLSTSIDVKEGCWIAACCTDNDQLLSDKELEDYAAPNQRMGRLPTRLRYAHTSPVYVNVNGQGARVPESIAQARKMLDAFELFINNTAKGEHKTELLAELKKARQKLDN